MYQMREETWILFNLRSCKIDHNFLKYNSAFQHFTLKIFQLSLELAVLFWFLQIFLRRTTKMANAKTQKVETNFFSLITDKTCTQLTRECTFPRIYNNSRISPSSYLIVSLSLPIDIAYIEPSDIFSQSQICPRQVLVKLEHHQPDFINFKASAS